MTDFRELVDLASERLGGAVLYATDEFFAEKENLIKPDKPVWKEHEYTTRGKWMDGWESRRKRTPGYDFAILRLGVAGLIRGVIVDTSYFRGNYPEACSIETCSVKPETDVETLLKTEWTEILPRSPLKGNSENEFAINHPNAVTHLRLNIFPDGGVARLRVYGTVMPDWRRLGGLGNEIDLAAIEHGGEVLQCSDMFFGPKHNLIMPGRAHNMSDGWETRRRRGPGNDWVIVKLAAEGTIRRIEVDTAHFKGNHPDTCSIEGLGPSPGAQPALSAVEGRHPLPEGERAGGERAEGERGEEILPRTKLQPHTRHLFLDELQNRGPFTHVRLNVFPDGGVSRLRVYGVVSEGARNEEVVRHLNAMQKYRAAELLRECCGSHAWVDRILEARPFKSWEDLIEQSDRIWLGLKRDDWAEAFRSHPRIGEGGRGWAADEQSGASRAKAETLIQLAEGNHEYEKRFGHVFLICATGKSADEMLACLRERMKNNPEKELAVAAGEQQKITKLRLQKLVL